MVLGRSMELFFNYVDVLMENSLSLGCSNASRAIEAPEVFLGRPRSLRDGLRLLEAWGTVRNFQAVNYVLSCFQWQTTKNFLPSQSRLAIPLT